MVEPVWVARDIVLAVHDEQLAEHGGQPGVRDPGLLDSALARPRNQYAYGESSIPGPVVTCTRFWPSGDTIQSLYNRWAVRQT